MGDAEKGPQLPESEAALSKLPGGTLQNVLDIFGPAKVEVYRRAQLFLVGVLAKVEGVTSEAVKRCTIFVGGSRLVMTESGLQNVVEHGDACISLHFKSGSLVAHDKGHDDMEALVVRLKRTQGVRDVRVDGALNYPTVHLVVVLDLAGVDEALKNAEMPVGVVREGVGSALKPVQGEFYG